MLAGETASALLKPQSLGKQIFSIPALAGVGVGVALFVIRNIGKSYSDILSDLTGAALVLLPIILGIAFSTAIRVIELGNMVRAYTVELNVRLLGPLEEKFGKLSADLQAMARANSRMAEIESCLRDDQQFRMICEINHAWEAARVLQDSHVEIAGLIVWKRENLTEKMLAEITDLREGRIVVDDVYKEISLNSELIERFAANEIRAVSFEDEGFWRSPEGRNFLKINKEFIGRKKGNRIRRLFVLNSEAGQDATLAEQAKSGVQVRVVTTKVIEADPKLSPEDFVIYDDVAVRIGKRVFGTGAMSNRTEAKTATVSMNGQDVRRKIELFEILWNKGEEWVPPSQSESKDGATR